MSEIYLIGLNHKTAPVEVRECLAIPSQTIPALLTKLHGVPCIHECLLLSTCNRVEVLVTSDNPPAAIAAVKGTLAEFKQTPVDCFENHLYIHEGEDAVRHVFRVSASLDSMIVGESQILGQIKQAHQEACANKTTGLMLNHLLQRAFSVAKRVRTETGVGTHAVSISHAAIEMGSKIFDSLENKKILLIGAGEMAEMVVEQLIRKQAGAVYVANRTFENGAALAGRFNSTAIRFDDILEYTKQVDVVISSTAAAEYVVTRRQVAGIMAARQNRPIFFIDIAVPRNIDPQLNRLSNVYVYDIDDLNGIVLGNLEARRREALKGERIVEEAVLQFSKWRAGMDIRPTIIALREKINRITRTEVEKIQKSLKHLSQSDHQAISRMLEAVAQKVLHDPTLFLKRDVEQDRLSMIIDCTRKIFNLDEYGTDCVEIKNANSMG